MSEKAVKLSMEQQSVLALATISQLKFFAELARHKSFSELTRFVNKIIDREKNLFFGSNEYDRDKLALDHAFTRGGIGMLVTLLKLIAASPHELEKRAKEE